MIGILTFYNAINYGAMLQTYALQHSLDLLGIENEVIAYECPKVTDKHRIRFKWWNPLGYAIKLHTRNRFHRFLKNRLRLSNSASDRVMPYDAYLVGSDQVWNLNITGDDMTYFLRFVPKGAAKYSYAASMGSFRFTDFKLQEQCLGFLNEFSGISVRERTTAEYLAQCAASGILRKKIEVHPDPVLLLDREEWNRFGEHKQKRSYILLYMIWRQPELIQKAQELSKRSKLPVIWISDSLRHYRGIQNKRCCCPEEFVGMFADSTYVVTNSFHGTVFSILFHKPFFTVTFREGKKEERIADLLEEVSLEVCSIDYGVSEDAAMNVCWEAVDQKIHRMVSNAREYLENINRIFEE